MIDVQAMFPVLVTSDLGSVKAFYERLFGFTTLFYDPEFYLHLASNQDNPAQGIQIGFLVPEHASQPEFLHAVMNPQGYVLSLEVADAKAAYDVAITNEAKLKLDLKEEVWGQTHFIIEDPAGINVDIVEHRATP